jgi:hypothetical protein
MPPQTSAPHLLCQSKHAHVNDEPTTNAISSVIRKVRMDVDHQRRLFDLLQFSKALAPRFAKLGESGDLREQGLLGTRGGAGRLAAGAGAPRRSGLRLGRVPRARRTGSPGADVGQHADQRAQQTVDESVDEFCAVYFEQ